MARELLSLRSVCKYYASGQSVTMGLNRINLSFSAGEFVAVTGESGSGKSTLARVMAGILSYEDGEMLADGRPTSHYDGRDWERYRACRISYISQSYDILPGCTVLRNMVSALRLTGMERGEAGLRAEEILRQVELWELRDRRAAKLSSGQKQRLSIARALAKPAPILIADEPTGNLDEENSAKIIRLLADAARDRLVIMVTHEFDEAADSATRRITMRDGSVVSDVALRTPTPADALPVRKGERRKGLSLYTARLQMCSRPIWSVIMLLFFGLTAFAVFAFLGTLIVNLDDSHTRLYDNSAFRNGDRQRVVVVRTDGGDMTSSDWEALAALPYVEGVERFGYLADISCFYRENVDVFYHFNGQGDGWGTVSAVTRDVTLEGEGLFLQTVPFTASDSHLLTGGRLPQSMYEVVAVGDESLLGQRFPLYIQDVKNWNRTSYLLFTVEVVGVTDQGEGLYVSDQLGYSLTQSVLTRETSGLILLPYDYDSMIDQRLLSPAEGVTYSLPEYYGYSQLELCGPVAEDPRYPADGGAGTQIWRTDFLCAAAVYGSPSFVRWAGTKEGAPCLFLGDRAAGIQPSTYTNALTVSPQAWEELVRANCGGQVSLHIADYAYTQRVIKAASALGYAAVSPYQEGTTRQDPTLAAQRLQTLKVCMIALAAVILLQVVVLRAMFGVESDEYRLLADLGLDRHTARCSVLWQALAFAVSGQVLAAAAILICGGAGVERIVALLRYLPAADGVLVSAVHFAACLLAALWVMSALCRQVYPFTGRRPDLAAPETEEEAAL